MLVGGHSIDDPEPKYGLAVTGTVHPDQHPHNAGGRARRRARPDQAARRGGDRPPRSSEGSARRRCSPAAVDVMTTLNADAAAGARAAAAPRADRRHRLRAARPPARAHATRAVSPPRSRPRPCPSSPASTSCSRDGDAVSGRQPAQPRARRDLHLLRRRRGRVAAQPRLRRHDLRRAARRRRAGARRRGARPRHRAARGRRGGEHYGLAWSGRGPVARPAFKAGEPRKPRGGKVRLLRRSVGRVTDDTTPLTVGTAGHIDHGKTALVRALTGRDTDRLPEERERGMSIDLGFAQLDVGGAGCSRSSTCRVTSGSCGPWSPVRPAWTCSCSSSPPTTA